MKLTTIKSIIAACVVVLGMTAVAQPTVMINEVKSLEPWNSMKGTITVDYSLADIDADKMYRVAFDITANGVTKSVTNVAAKLTAGRQKVFTKDTVALFGEETLDEDATVRVTLIAVNSKATGVQLWKDGPLFAEWNVGATSPEEYGYYFWWGDTVGYTYDGSNWVSSKDSLKTIQFNSEDATAGQTRGKGSAALQSDGWTDENGNLVPTNDAATVHWGAPWRMMTDMELKTLTNVCTTVWTNNWNGTGVNGRLVTGTGDYASNCVFFPAAGSGNDSALSNLGQVGFYRTSTPSGELFARSLYFNSNGFRLENLFRDPGFSVRPVRDAMSVVGAGASALAEDVPDVEVVAFDEESFRLGPNPPPTVTINEVVSHEPWDGQFDVEYVLGGLAAGGLYKVAFDVTAGGKTASVTNDAANLENKTYTNTLDTRKIFGAITEDKAAKVKVTLIALNPKEEGVQLWKDGPFFAECNVGAASPEEFGYYFWWGDTVGYTYDGSSWVSSKDGSTITLSSSDATAGQTYGKNDEDLQSEGWTDANGNLVSTNDAATVHWGAPWRMMTDMELSNLVSKDYCEFEWTYDWEGTGKAGYVVKGKGDYASNSVFFPAAGRGNASALNNDGANGYYWSSTCSTGSSERYARTLYFGSDFFESNRLNRNYGFSVRPVRVAALFADEAVAFDEKIFWLGGPAPEGSEWNPWKVGTTGHEDEVTAWTNGTGRLVIEGTGAVGSTPWAPFADEIAELLKDKGVTGLEDIVATLPVLATVNGLTLAELNGLAAGAVKAAGFSAIAVDPATLEATLSVVISKAESLDEPEWKPVSTNDVPVKADTSAGFFIVAPAEPSDL